VSGHDTVATASPAEPWATPAQGSATRRRRRTARIWSLFIVLDVAAALVLQFALNLSGSPIPGNTIAPSGIGTRLVQTLSFFTIQSNLLVLVVAFTLVVDPLRDGRFWRILRLDALLGITITGLVFDLVLIHYVHPTGWQLVATIGLHYIAPWATLPGWLLFGPWPRVDRRTVARAMLWPAAWIAYTFVHGAVTHWYPYPFLDVDEVGAASAALATFGVLALAGVLLAVFAAIDRARARRG